MAGLTKEDLLQRLKELNRNKSEAEAQAQNSLKRVVFIEGAIELANQLLASMKEND